MARKMRAVAIGVFENTRQAQKAVEELRAAGFGDDKIGVAARDQDVKEEVEKGLPDRKETYAEEGTAAGAVGGAALGGLWGMGIAAGMLPAIGPVIAGGTLAAMLASSVLGAAAGGLGGVLIGWGIPEEEAKKYETDLQAGRILIAVKAAGRLDEAVSILQRCDARTEPSGTTAR